MKKDLMKMLLEIMLLEITLEKNNDKEIKCSDKVANAAAYIGEYVIIRTRNEGLNCGFLERSDETGCILKEARRIHTAFSKDISLSWYEGIAVSGLHPEKGRLSGAVEKKIIIEDYSITLVSKEAKKNLRNYPPSSSGE